MNFKFPFIFILFLPISGSTQLPKTDLYMAEFKNLSSVPKILNIKYLNDFNPNGYNNQPRFISYDELYLTVGLDTNRFTDIYSLNLKNNNFFRFTATDKISEFSASPSLQSGKVSCVRIEPDGKDQSLWSYPEDRSGAGNRVLPALNNIGYYSWINEDTVALFLVGSPHQLVLADIKSGKKELISENIGRCLKYDNDGNLYFVHKIKPDLWQLKAFHISDKAISVVCQMPTGREDYDLLINGTIITGDGSKLKSIDPIKSKEWTEIADFSSAGILNINRLTVVRDRIVFVNNK